MHNLFLGNYTLKYKYQPLGCFVTCSFTWGTGLGLPLQIAWRLRKGLGQLSISYLRVLQKIALRLDEIINLSGFQRTNRI